MLLFEERKESWWKKSAGLRRLKAGS